jgi:hypothetical protein
MTTIQWVAPQPLWPDFTAGQGREAFRRPTLLRFSKDTFMEDLQQLLARRAGDLRAYVARPETWRTPVAGLSAPALTAAGGAALPLRLYQPLHSRFYLLGAALTCRLPGRPDHTTRPDEGESIGFVIRRLEGQQEFAWIEGERPGWRAVATTVLADGEQQLPLFPMAFADKDMRRRLLAGLIPVGRRQEYVSARVLPPADQAQTQSSQPVANDPRVLDLRRQVIDPWSEQIDAFDKLSAADKANAAIRFSFDLGSALILLDFQNYLLQHAPEVGHAIRDRVPPASGAALTLYNTLAATNLTDQNTALTVKLSEAMQQAKLKEAAFESATLPSSTAPALPVGYPRVSLLHANARALMVKDSAGIRALERLMTPALTTQASDPGPRPPAKDPVSPVGNVWFIARCVYRRPLCGVNFPPLLSEPTEPFQLASIFDPNAPARPSQVALPLDTTPAGLRKHDKSVAFMISDELAKQMARIKGLKELTEGDVGGPGISLGMICSLSIPIITLCAFIVLMIFISLLNIIFWWLPFFRICFPIPMPAKGDT